MEEVVKDTPRPLNPSGKRLSIHFIGRRVDSSASVDVSRKPCPQGNSIAGPRWQEPRLIRLLFLTRLDKHKL
jgi:hypothetical protein